MSALLAEVKAFQQRDRAKRKAGRLPPDPEKGNFRRAERAAVAMKAYCTDEDEYPLRDFLCDLMHMADRCGIDFRRELESAKEHYAAETQGA